MKTVRAAGIAGVLLLLSAAGRAQAPAGPLDPRTPPEVPARDDLPRFRSADEGQALPPGATLDDLKGFIAAPAVTRRRVDAVAAWAQRVDDNLPLDQFLPILGDSLDMMDRFFDKEPDEAFRRYAIAEIFGTAAGSVRIEVPTHPDDARVRAGWERLSGLRLKGLHDRDKRLAEFFERYVPLDGDPKWRELRKSDEELFQAAERRFPERKAELADALGKCESIQDSQQKVEIREVAVLRANAKVPPAVADKAARAYQAVYRYRMFTVWGNLCRRIIRDEIGADDSVRLGVLVEPVKLGWPEY